KGIDRLLPAWTVVGEAPAGSPTAARPGRRGPMVGREEELDLLELMFARTIRQSRPSLVTVIGPAGIGKSRLAYEVAVRLRARGAAKVIRGRCLPYGDGLTGGAIPGRGRAGRDHSGAVVLDRHPGRARSAGRRRTGRRPGADRSVLARLSRDSRRRQTTAGATGGSPLGR